MIDIWQPYGELNHVARVVFYDVDMYGSLCKLVALGWLLLFCVRCFRKPINSWQIYKKAFYVI